MRQGKETKSDVQSLLKVRSIIMNKQPIGKQKSVEKNDLGQRVK